MPVTKYTKAELHKLAEKHRRMTGKLPTLHSDPPVPVPEQPITKRNPSTADLLWANKWNLVRHFIVDGGGAAIVAFTATKDVTVSGAAFVVGGVVGAARKGFDDLRRSDGKTDMLTTMKDGVFKPKLKGDGMGIRTEVGEFQEKVYALLMIFFDETPDKEQVMDVAGGAWEAFNEAKDLKDISKDDMVKAGIDTALTMAAALKDKFIKYSDEVPVP